jgi:hypothetical protein
MPIVVDANLPVVLVTNDPRAELAERQLQAWFAAGERLHAPLLLRYEVGRVDLTVLRQMRQNCEIDSSR